jgi:hypothetical protein
MGFFHFTGISRLLSSMKKYIHRDDHTHEIAGPDVLPLSEKLVSHSCTLCVAHKTNRQKIRRQKGRKPARSGFCVQARPVHDIQGEKTRAFGAAIKGEEILRHVEQIPA